MADWLSLDFFLELLRAYLILTFILFAISIIRMYHIRHFASDRQRGRDRIRQLTDEKRFVRVPLYSDAELQTNKKKDAVHLSVFLNDTGERKKAVIICPGGGYVRLCTKDEGYPVAAYFNELGYTAFVLEYRVGSDCSPYAPMEDLARAVDYMEQNSDRFHVDMDGYCIVGFSAGGNLAGIFGGEEYGYQKYGVRKPACLIMGYPWTNINHWLAHPYWNIWVGLCGIWLSERGNLSMFGLGKHLIRKNRDSLCVQYAISPDYPPVYMFACGSDILVPSGAHTDVLETALKKYDISYRYEKFFALPHGIGLGIGTRAQGWIDLAVTFWESSSL